MLSNLSAIINDSMVMALSTGRYVIKKVG